MSFNLSNHHLDLDSKIFLAIFFSKDFFLAISFVKLAAKT